MYFGFFSVLGIALRRFSDHKMPIQTFPMFFSLPKLFVNVYIKAEKRDKVFSSLLSHYNFWRLRHKQDECTAAVFLIANGNKASTAKLEGHELTDAEPL